MCVLCTFFCSCKICCCAFIADIYCYSMYGDVSELRVRKTKQAQNVHSFLVTKQTARHTYICNI